MRKSFAAILIVCFCSVFFQACSKKVLLENFNMKQRTFSSVKLSSFIGNHRLFSIKQTDSISINSPLNILKRNHHLYILSGQQCFQFDRNGVFIKKLDFSHLFNSRTAKLNGADIYIIGNQIQLWIGVQQNIHCFSFDEEKEIFRIPVEIPFSNFKRISDNTILLPTIDNYYLLAICNTSGKIKDYGLPQKANVFIEGNYSFIQYGEITISQYSSTTLASYYDQESDKLKEILLVKENDYVNTWQKQTELINKYGIIKGFNTASNNYSSILHLSKPKMRKTFYSLFFMQ